MIKKITILLAALIFSFLGGQAQDVKPNKEETISFIRTHFENKRFGGECRSWAKGIASIEQYYTDFNVSFNGSIMTVTWQYQFKSYLNGIKDSSRHSSKAVIDLSKIELIDVYSDLISGDCFDEKEKRINARDTWALAYFKPVSGYKIEYKGQDDLENGNAAIPVGNAICRDCKFNDLKIIKAFNHLRKLCGAPEPIKF